ncbi:GNAT family protein [uncultured Flavobacterium sp.]|uniref:GNAT family N-acetyltransferase n=1 Tax=uncultured Flavobacterium sp. TaxID=165435 RepID=UPI0025E3283D|nr:GNAT family protein [uncultured Flavobacterium sp.]
MVQNWKIDRINTITPEVFYNLIESNREHIYKTFPATTANCANLEKTKAYLQNAITTEKDKRGYYFYLRNADNVLIGFICLKNIDENCRKCEFAYFIDKAYQGQGIISEAVNRICSYCFKELGMNKVFICTSKENIGSQRVALKNGFVKEGILRQEFKSGEGNLEDIIYFGLLKSEYNEK